MGHLIYYIHDLGRSGVVEVKTLSWSGKKTAASVAPFMPLSDLVCLRQCLCINFVFPGNPLPLQRDLATKRQMLHRTVNPMQDHCRHLYQKACTFIYFRIE